MVLFFIIRYKKYLPSISSGTNAVRDAEGAACLWHAFSTDRAGGETAGLNLVASTNEKRIIRKSASFFMCFVG